MLYDHALVPSSLQNESLLFVIRKKEDGAIYDVLAYDVVDKNDMNVDDIILLRKHLKSDPLIEKDKKATRMGYELYLSKNVNLLFFMQHKANMLIVGSALDYNHATNAVINQDSGNINRTVLTQIAKILNDILSDKSKKLKLRSI